MKKAYLLTTNQDKLLAAKKVFSKHNIELLSLDLQIPEIQAASSAEIARHAAQEAYKQTRKPVIREDHSLYIAELGIPGPYMSFMDKAVSVNQLRRILDTLKDQAGYFELAATYIDENGKNYDFSYRVDIEFAEEPRGNENYNWERIIKLPGENKVFAEYPSVDRADIWGLNYEKIAQLIDAAG